MKIYKIKHKPSGLFFKPATWPYKCNLSKNGKVYHKKPNVKNYLGTYFYDVTEKRKYGHGNVKPVVLDDWEIVEYTLEQ